MPSASMLSRRACVAAESPNARVGVTNFGLMEGVLVVMDLGLVKWFRD